MFRRFVALVLLTTVAPAARGQGLYSFFGTGPSGAGPTAFAYSYMPLVADPVAIAFGSLNVSPWMFPDPSTRSISDLQTGATIRPNDVSFAHPYLLSLTGGGAVIGGGNLPSSLSFTSSGAAPLPSGNLPSLSVSYNPGDSGGKGYLSYSVLDVDWASGGAMLPVPDGGWWVLAFSSSSYNEVPPISFDGDPTARTPEPATAVLVGMGLFGVAGWRRWRKG